MNGIRGAPIKIRLGNGLWLANLLGWLLIIVIMLVPENPIRMVLGVPFVLFYPGYALIIAIAPRKTAMSGIERLALSFGLSIALVILIGLGLNYTPFGIRLVPIVSSMDAILLALTAVAWFRGRRVSAEERFSVAFSLSPRAVWSGGPLDKARSVVLVLAILASVGTIAYTITKPKSGEEFAEFYILGPRGKADDYPSEVQVGARATVTGGIVSHRRNSASYFVEVMVAGTRNGEVGPIELKPGEKWEGEVSFTPQTVGGDQKVEFVLRETSRAEATPRSLHLWVDVVP